MPPDLDADRDADIVDVITFKPVILHAAKYHGRRDFDDDGDISILRVMKYKGIILTSCAP